MNITIQKVQKTCFKEEININKPFFTTVASHVNPRQNTASTI